MSMQTAQEGHGGFFGSVAGQMTILLGGLAIAFALAWLYIW